MKLYIFWISLIAWRKKVQQNAKLDRWITTTKDYSLFDAYFNIWRHIFLFITSFFADHTFWSQYVDCKSFSMVVFWTRTMCLRWYQRRFDYIFYFSLKFELSEKAIKFEKIFVILLTRASCSLCETAYLPKSRRRFFITNVDKSYSGIQTLWEKAVK